MNLKNIVKLIRFCILSTSLLIWHIHFSIAQTDITPTENKKVICEPVEGGQICREYVDDKPATPSGTPTNSANAESEKYKDKKDKDTMLMVVQYVALAAVAFVAISLPLKCKASIKNAPSAMLFLAAAGYYIVTEGMAVLQYKKNKPSDHPESYDPNGDLNQQKQDLVKAKDETKRAREHLEKRAKNAMMAGIGFGAAAAAAGVEMIMLNKEKKKDIKLKADLANPATKEKATIELKTNSPTCIQGNEPRQGKSKPALGCPHVMTCSQNSKDKAQEQKNNNEKPIQEDTIEGSEPAEADTSSAPAPEEEKVVLEDNAPDTKEVVTSDDTKPQTLESSQELEDPGITDEKIDKPVEKNPELTNLHEQADKINKQDMPGSLDGNKVYVDEEAKIIREKDTALPGDEGVDKALNTGNGRPSDTQLNNTQLEKKQDLEIELKRLQQEKIDCDLKKNDWNPFTNCRWTPIKLDLSSIILKSIPKKIEEILISQAFANQEATDAMTNVAKGAAKKDFIASLYETPQKRMITFGAAAALAAGVSLLLKNKAKKLEEREKRYQQLIDELDRLGNNNTGGYTREYFVPAESTALPGTNNPNAISTPTNRNSDNNNDGQLGNNYGSNNYGSTEEVYCASTNLNIDTNCNCRLNNSCAKAQVPNLSGSFKGFKIPSALSGASEALKRHADATYSGNLKAAGSSGAELAKYSKAIDQINKQIENRLNQDQKELGGNKIDFDKDRNAVSNHLIASAKKAISANGGFKSLVGSGNSAPSIPLSDEETKELINNSEYLLETNPNNGNSGRSSSNGASEETDFLGLETPEAGGEELAVLTQTDQVLEGYKVNNNDVVTDNGASLWQIISVRYQKSAVPKLLEKKK